MRSDIYLRRADREDLDQIVAWMEDEDFVHFLYGDASRSPQRIREHIVAMLGRTMGQTLPGGIYLLIDSIPYGAVGMLAITNISWRNRSCAIDTYIGNKKLRNGFVAGMAFFRTLEYCFHELNMHRINLFVYAFNERSWRIIERSGAKRELVIKDHILRDGKFHDFYGYGMLRAEFDELFADVSKRAPRATLAANIETWAKAMEQKDAEAAKAAEAPS